ncbi:MAG: methylaspartate ammonia-lyase [Betaproteobacteria bacterium]|jgi:methylaspartate ammonia-lyase|nr:methylaspartate ammonia-lyase [Betaproteobacteria bacterium]
MKVKDVICAAGRSGYMHRDLLAIKSGRAKPNGSLYEGAPMSPGFTKIIEPATIISIMLVLEDGQMAFGDCADVILAGVAGRDPAFNAKGHIDYVRGEVADALRGRDVSRFKANAEEMDKYSRGGKRLHTAIRYGISQALLHATALSQKQTMAEAIADEYGSTISTKPIPILASCHKDDLGQLDRVILKRVELLPHASFQIVSEHVGLQGEKLAAFVRRVAARCKEIGDADYNPRIHVDLYGTLGELFDMKIEPLADYLGKLRQESGSYKLLVESPMIAKTQEEQIEKFSGLRELLKKKGIDVGLIADEWCNTLPDIRLFVQARACDFVQIKTPDLGSIHNTIEAVLYCKSNGMGACLGGTANETDQSTRISTHMGLACQPDFMLSKPGLGADEALMIQTNEMARTLALLQARR